jgi:hypothetical protein
VAGCSCDFQFVLAGFVPETNLSREIGWIGRLFMYYIMSWAPFATSLHDGKSLRLLRISIERFILTSAY